MTLAAARDVTSVPGIRIADVIVGDRRRKDFGDLTDLMESIQNVGLLQPIGLAPGNHLLFGERRLEACRRLGWESIPVTRPPTRTDAASLLEAERDENTCRKDMTPEELVDLGKRLEKLEEPKRDARRRAGGERGREVRYASEAGSCSPEQEPASADGPSLTRDIVGNALGLSGASYHRAKTVVNTARDTTADPEVREVAQAALEAMNTGQASINTAYEAVRAARQPRPVAPAKDASNLAIPQPARYGFRRKHAQVLGAVMTSLAAVNDVAKEITELDASVTKEEAAQLVRGLQQSIRSLNQIKKLLEERTR